MVSNGYQWHTVSNSPGGMATWNKADLASMTDSQWDALRLKAYRKQALRARTADVVDSRAVHVWEHAASQLEATAVARSRG